LIKLISLREYDSNQTQSIMARKKTQQLLAPQGRQGPSFRSGAVARMARMPVATLRIWEQRYQAVKPTSAPSGHRLYSADDLQRVMLLRELTQQGQAIGAIAGLAPAQLRELGAKVARGGAKSARPTAQMKLVVVGHALAARLQRPAVTQRLSKPARVIAVFETLAEARRATAGATCDLLIWQSPGLPALVPAGLKAAQKSWQASQVAVVYRFAGADARSAFKDKDTALLREPQDDEALGAWLGSMEAAAAPKSTKPASRSQSPDKAEALAASPPRRFNDAVLTSIAGLSPTLACECPRHVAELLMQLSSFEAYSADCIHRSAADAQLHAWLQQVAGASRTLFEAALEKVARHEGIPLS
jgi:DNA-binding transcriptional MerR regulator